MKNEKGKNILIASLVGIIILLLIILFLAVNKKVDVNLFNGEKDNKEENTTTKYETYVLGDTVTLKDGSTWNVIEDKGNNVTLLSRENVNSDYTVTTDQIDSFLETTYKDKLVSSLKAKDNEISEVKTLTLEEVSKLSGIAVSDLTPGTSLENGKTPAFLYESQTITDTYTDTDTYNQTCSPKACPVMICNADGSNAGRICSGTGSDTWEIRPVITISKKYIN